MPGTLDVKILTSDQVFEDLDDIKNIREKTGDPDGQNSAYKSLIMAMYTRGKKKKKRWAQTGTVEQSEALDWLIFGFTQNLLLLHLETHLIANPFHQRKHFILLILLRFLV